MPIIEIENLTFTYKNDEDETPARPTLSNISLSINEGEFVAVIGHNGSGKSTLAKHINAILLPGSGKVLVGGMDTADENLLYEIRKTAGMVFQNPDNQIVATIVEEDVAFAPENMGVPPKEIRERVDLALSDVGMSEYKKHAPHLLSGGQKQRIAIAGVLAMQPRVIVLDEPTAMLDPKGRAEVMKTIRRLNTNNNITIVLITHHMDEAALAGRIVVMNNGEIALDDKPEKVFSQVGALRDMSLEVPQTVGIIEILNKRADAGLDLGVLSVDGCADQIFTWLGEN